MNISFTGKSYTDPEIFGITFEAIVDGVQVCCRISTEALQDIDPPSATSDAASQFASNRSSFEQIAEKLIHAGRVKDGQVFINSADL